MSRNKMAHSGFGKTFFYVVLAIEIAGIAFAQPENSRSESLWIKFREDHPFYYQTLALSDRDSQSERVLIISEPPPTLPRGAFRETLATVFGPALKKADLRRHAIGQDGWVEDVVVVLAYASPGEEKARLANDLAYLAQRLFGTSYKSAPTLLLENNSFRTEALRAPPQLAVRADELKRWLLDASDKNLVSLGDGTLHDLKELLLGPGAPGVYFTRLRGLVLLIAPRTDLQKYRSEIRKFALDSDAIVGAVAVGNARIAIVGRERDTTLEAVPPLRAESVIALASTDEEELAQSFERNGVFAGRLQEGQYAGQDWAPIYLSRDLVNTEFGGLLDVTDQILKSFSESGSVNYFNFHYPRPAFYPFENGLLKHLGLKSVLYNWNTLGTGSVTKLGEVEFFTLTSTGSLPVSYVGDEKQSNQSSETHLAATVEEEAFKYFRNLRDPNLGRVVQYTALYQIFRAFSVHSSRENDPPPENFHAATDALTREAKDGVSQFMAWWRSSPRRVASDSPVAQLIVMQDLFGEDTLDRLAILMADRSAFKPSNSDLKRIQAEMGDNEKDDDAKIINNLPVQDRLIARDFLLLDFVKPMSQIVTIASDLDKVREEVVTAAASVETGYIKTPSIVVSSYAGMPTLIGGHNLNSAATKFEQSATLPKGHVEIRTDNDEKTIIYFNPDDMPSTASLSRIYERNSKEDNVTELLNAELASKGPAVRPISEALAFEEAPGLRERGLASSPEGTTTIGDTGFRLVDSAVNVPAALAKAAEGRGLDLCIARDGNGYLLYRGIPKPPTLVRAATETAMVETVGRFSESAAVRQTGTRDALRIGATNGLNEAELRGIISSQEVRTAAGGGGGRGGIGSRAGASFDFSDDEFSEGRFRFDDERESNIAFTRRSESGDLIVLDVTNRTSRDTAMLMHTPVDWNAAELKSLGVTDSLRPGKVGLQEIAFEIRVPIKAIAVQPFALKVLAFFRRILSSSEMGNVDLAVRDVHNALTKTAHSKVQPSLLTAIGELKREIYRQANPDALEFHLSQGQDDLTIVRREDAIDGIAR